MPDKKDKKTSSPLLCTLDGFKAYIQLFIGLFVLYLILSPFVSLNGSSGVLAMAGSPYDGDILVRFLMALLLLVLIIIALIMTFRRRMTADNLIFLVIIAGLICRFCYMLYTPFYIRGHDVGTMYDYGHLAYIYRLFSGGGLPATNAGQFYHPPLAHLAGSIAAKIYASITGEKNLDTIFESAKLIPCFASCALLLVVNHLFDTLHFSSRAKLVALIILAFAPTFIILSASINNDMLMIFFFVCAFLYTIRWYNDPTYKNILLLALFIGCAMSTKFSGALVAFFTAGIFLLVLIRKIREKQGLKLLGQFAAFTALCFPLGLWYPIRNLKLFGQALGYVAPIGTNSALYVGDKSFAARFLSFSLPDMLKNVYCHPFDDFRIWEYTVKCALFGEFTFSARHDVFAAVMIITSFVLIILSLGSMVWFLFCDREKNRTAVLSLAALWLLMMLSFVYFNIKYPFGCTMDFRYIVPTVITGAAFLGLLSDSLSGSKAGKVLFACLIALAVFFCVSTACFYIV